LTLFFDLPILRPTDLGQECLKQMQLELDAVRKETLWRRKLET